MQKVLCQILRPRLLVNSSANNFSTTLIRNVQFYDDPAQAVKDIPNGATILVGGFGICGVAENCISALNQRNTKNLTVATITSGVDNFGVGVLVSSRQVKRLITTYVGGNKECSHQYLKGQIELDFTPMGNLAERIRAGGAGIPAFYTPTGTGTLVQTGNIPIKLGPNREVLIGSPAKPTREFRGHLYHLEEAIYGDYALVKAWKADRHGNLIFRKSARNINPTMAKAANVTIAEVEEVVDEIDPDQVQVPHIFVDRVVKGKSFLKPIEILKHFSPKGATKSKDDLLREKIARRAVLELKDGSMYVNLGIGLPVLLASFLKPGKLSFHSENGIVGLGPYPKPGEADPDLTNAAKESTTVIKGASFFALDESFNMIRGGHLDWAVLGGMQVSKNGDLANWMVPGKRVNGMGGAMDLVSAVGAKIMVTMEHTDNNGTPKIVDTCSLPITGKQVVKMIVTEMGVFMVDPTKGLTLTEIGEGFTVDQVKAATGCKFEVSDSLKPMAQAEELD